MSGEPPIDGSRDDRQHDNALEFPISNSPSRQATSARLASPIPASTSLSPAPESNSQDDQTADVSALPTSPSSQNASASAGSGIADALNTSRPESPGFPATPGHTPGLQPASDQVSLNTESGTDSRFRGSPRPYEDFDVVRRHLVGPDDDPWSEGTAEPASQKQALQAGEHKKQQEVSQGPTIDDDEFSSLQLQGGDITRDIYRRTEAESSSRAKLQRSKSMMQPRIDPIDEEVDDYNAIHQPGGFRRHHLRRSGHSPGPSSRNTRPSAPLGASQQQQRQPNFLTRNFFEFLSMYGHFAGEAVDDDDIESIPDSQHGDNRDLHEVAHHPRDLGERAPLLKRTSTFRRRREEERKTRSGTAGTIMILLKSFVGTGVLFLPRAFLNGGMLFSAVTMVLVSSISYYCFILLTTSRLQLKASYAEMAEMTYGPYLRSLVNSSLVVSQMGFSSAYIVFTSENLRAFVLAVTNCRTSIDIKVMILMQLIVFLPLSLYRNLNKLLFVVYVADLFIVLGIVYLYYYGLSTIALNGVSDLIYFNSDTWTLFIGTAVFTFEGIGLIIPIQDGMKKPQQLPKILGLVMVIITFIFVSSGALAYAAYGSKTETVILLNMNQDNKFVNGVQFIYSLAILLSTPMQIFPAITIMENGIFVRSGKYDKDIKWRKNIFRFAVVMASALIAWIGANDLDKFVALTGSFACIPLVYIYPPLIHKQALGSSKWQGRIDYFLCACGFILMTYTSAITIQSWAVGPKESHPGYCDRFGGK